MMQFMNAYRLQRQQSRNARRIDRLMDRISDPALALSPESAAMRDALQCAHAASLQTLERLEIPDWPGVESSLKAGIEKQHEVLEYLNAILIREEAGR